MKRRAALTAALLILAMLFCQIAFADSTLIAGQGLAVVSTVPDDGEEGKQVSNLAVKIVFNEDVSDTANDTVNASHITIKDPDGKKQTFEITHHPKAPNELWCILKGDLTANSEYTVTVEAGVKSNSGDVLSAPYTFTFKTRNTKIDNTISIMMTIVMMVIMMLATTRSQGKQQEEKAAKGKGAIASEKVSQTDPYRLAKEKGISVEEAKALIAKEKEKVDKKNASGKRAREKYEAAKAAKEAEVERRLKEIHDASVYKVKAKGSLVAHGGTIPKAVQKKLAAKKKSRRR